MAKGYDLIIIGSGPAGLAAAIYAQRAKLDTLVLEKEMMSGGQVLNTYEVDNYPGLPGINGFDLGSKFRQHAEKLEAEFAQDEVQKIELVAREDGILPDTEVFDIGMLHNMELVGRDLPFVEPKLINLVFGHKGGMQPTPEMLCAFRSFVPADALWGVTHFGRDNWTFLAAAIAMGATVVRIGFEDSAYLEEGRMAEYNYQVVEKLVTLIRAMGLEPATPMEAREILHLQRRGGCADA